MLTFEHVRPNGVKADIPGRLLRCPLMTQSGHCGATALPSENVTYQCHADAGELELPEPANETKTVCAIVSLRSFFAPFLL